MIVLEFEMIGQLVPVTVKTDEMGLEQFKRALDDIKTNYVTFTNDNIIINMKNVLTVRVSG